ncbi:MAG TPA: protoglobin domain-containing protein [Polyangiaceae bacterium]|nr:protoglobin domain-containing protein [Polyangiaceae bacterium]
MAEAAFFDDALRYVRWSGADEAALRALAPHVAPERRAIVEEFYDRLREHPEAEKVLRDEAQVRRLHGSLERWLDDLLAARRDRAYFEQRWRIGAVHARVGLPQRYVFTAMALIRLQLERIASAAFGADREAEARAHAAVGKALDVELAVMAETYREELLGRLERAEGAAAAGGRPGAAEGRYRDAVERAEVMVVTLDPAGRATLWNRKAEALTGHPRDEVLGTDPLPLLFGDAGPRERVPGVRPGEPLVLEAALVTRAGRERWARWCVSAADDGAGGVAARYLVGADMTEARGDEQRAHQAERLAVAGALATGLAHEIRNPLNAASLNVQLLERSLRRPAAAPPLALEALEMLRGELDRISRLVSDFLDFARPRPLSVAPLELGEFVQGVVDELRPRADAAGVELAYERPARPLATPGDAERLRRALLNLVGNALDAVEGAPGARVVVRARAVGRFSEIDVEDNGAGVPPGAPVFDAFYTTKPKGAGLGLAVVHRAVDEHGGAVSVRSAPGDTTFTVRLPRSPIAGPTPLSGRA